MKKPARKRSKTGLAKRRDWMRRHRALLAHERATLFPEPAPDPDRQPREFSKWAVKYAQTEPSNEMRLLLEELHQLPGVKARRARDEEIASWIYCLRLCEWRGAQFKLLTCKLGANPASEFAKPSKMLQYLMAIVEREYPGVSKQPRFAIRLFDGIRKWREARAELEQD